MALRRNLRDKFRDLLNTSSPDLNAHHAYAICWWWPNVRDEEEQRLNVLSNLFGSEQVVWLSRRERKTSKNMSLSCRSRSTLSAFWQNVKRKRRKREKRRRKTFQYTNLSLFSVSLLCTLVNRVLSILQLQEQRREKSERMSSTHTDENVFVFFSVLWLSSWEKTTDSQSERPRNSTSISIRGRRRRKAQSR